MKARITKGRRELLKAAHEGRIRAGYYNELFIDGDGQIRPLRDRFDFAIGLLARIDKDTKTAVLTVDGLAALNA